MESKKRISYVVLLLLTILIIAFITWAYSPLRPAEEVKEYLQSSNYVEVIREKNIYFIPRNFKKNYFENVGIIFYPGGHVDYTAYAPLAYRLAEKGITTVILNVPLSFAIFDVDSARTIINGTRFSDKEWFLAGHSLGGVAASEFLVKHPELVGIKVKGIIFLASYPARDISYLPIKSLCIYGSEDGILPPKTIKEKKALFPSSTEYVEILGGNHSQFGSYGLQKGDKEAKISAHEQISIVVKAIKEFLEKYTSQR
ncbi:MAG: alpha/beta hydrolase [Fervidobacterium pennivorans]